jgi:uncharacterized protein (TIGR04255 family)
MPEVLHLSRAPITEAVVDLRCVTKAKIDPSLILKLREGIGYPGETQELRSLRVAVQQQPGKPLQHNATEGGLEGGRFCSIDGKFVVQMRSNGMTFSRLPPYTEWENVISEAMRLWQIYRSHFEVVETTRIAVRNINRLTFPQPDFSQNPAAFLSPPPSQPDGGDEGTVVQWMTRFVIKNILKDINATVTQLSDPQAGPALDGYAMIFDIDVFTTKGLSGGDSFLQNRFTELRDVKNNIFFSGLTPQAIDLFK